VQEQRTFSFFLHFPAEKGFFFFSAENASGNGFFSCTLCRGNVFFPLQKVSDSCFLRKKSSDFAIREQAQHRDFEKTYIFRISVWISILYSEIFYRPICCFLMEDKDPPQCKKKGNFFLALSAEKGIVFFFCSNAGEAPIFFALLAGEMFFPLQKVSDSCFLRKKSPDFAIRKWAQHRDFEKTYISRISVWIFILHSEKFYRPICCFLMEDKDPPQCKKKGYFFLALSAEKGIVFFFCSNAGEIPIFLHCFAGEMFFPCKKFQTRAFYEKKALTL
jgi:hypothetical protein